MNWSEDRCSPKLLWMNEICSAIIKYTPILKSKAGTGGQYDTEDQLILKCRAHVKTFCYKNNLVRKLYLRSVRALSHRCKKKMEHKVLLHEIIKENSRFPAPEIRLNPFPLMVCIPRNYFPPFLPHCSFY